MSWWRGDDRSHNNAKLLAADLDGTGLYFRAISWCAQNETDGRFPRVVVQTLAPGWIPKKVDGLSARLVSLGLWQCEGDGYRIPDYLDFNPSKADLDEKRERERKRRSNGAGGRQRATGMRQRDDSVPARSEHVVGSVIGPVPSRPLKTTTTSSSSALTLVTTTTQPAITSGAAVRLIAERRLNLRETEKGPVGTRTGWLTSVAQEITSEYQERITNAPEFDTVEEFADWLEPPTLSRQDQNNQIIDNVYHHLGAS